MEYRTKIRLRMSAKDAHYGGNLVDGAHMVHLFGDVATELRPLSMQATSSKPKAGSTAKATPRAT